MSEATQDGGKRFATEIKPLDGEKWWGSIVNDGGEQPYDTLAEPRDLAHCNYGGTTSPFLVSSKGRYVWSDRPFTFTFKDGVLKISEAAEAIAPVTAGSTLKEAYLAACAKHFPFNGKTPAELLFTKPQWNNWVEIAIQGMNQKSVDAYTEALAKSGFPCGVYMMDGGWLTCQGSFQFAPETFPDPKGMFARVRDHGWKSMIWIAHFVSPDSLEYKRLRYGPGYMIDGLDYLAYRKAPNLYRWTDPRTAGVIWWWSGISATYDLTYPPAWKYYVEKLQGFAKEYGIDGFKFDSGDLGPLADNVRYHDASKEACDYAHEYVRVGAENFPYNEYRSGFRTGGWPVMQRLHDQGHTWESLPAISKMVQTAGLLGSPYVVSDMIGGGDAVTYRPGSFFSEKLFIRSCALQTLQPMMQFSAAPWRYLSPEGVEACKQFANLRVEYGRKIFALAQHAAQTGEPIVRTMEYEFPHQGFNRSLTQFMLGSDVLVAPVVTEDDSVTVSLPAGKWEDDLGQTYTGPQELELKNVPVSRLPRFTKKGN